MMRFTRILFAVALILSAGPASGWAAGVGGLAAHVEGEVFVRFKPGVDLLGAGAVMAGHSLELVTEYPLLSSRAGKVLGLARGSGRTTVEILDDLAKEPLVEEAEPNYLRQLFGLNPPNDSLFGQLWGLRNTGQPVRGLGGLAGADIRFVEAWSMARPSTNEIVVAVVDSGVDYTHPDLAGNMWVNSREIAGDGIDNDGNGYVDDVHGYNFDGANGDPMDPLEHGSHVSGTIAALGNNGLGVVGVNYRAKIMALRVSGGGVSFSSSAVVEAVQYAAMMAARGVNIVALNASFGGGGFSSTEDAAIRAAGDAGIVYCAAAGNDTSNNDATPTYPASYRLTNMIVVAATDSQDLLATFSNFGVKSVDIAAPGVSVLSTTPPGMTSFVQVASTAYTGNAFEFAGTTTGLTGSIHDCGLGYTTNFPAAVRGNIALIGRGTIFFSQKVSNAMAAGAAGVVIYNNTTTPFTGTLGSVGDWIPAVAISQADGLLLKGRLPLAGFLFSAKHPSAIYQYLDGTSMAAPHVSGAVAFAAMNFPGETPPQRVRRILANVDPLPGLSGKVVTGGRLNLLRTVDSDGNGLPDWWEATYFGPSVHVVPGADPDGDGLSNMAEYLADTSPVDGTSRVRLAGVQPAAGGSLINWTAGREARQVLQRAASLGPNAIWEDVWTNQPPTPLNGTFLEVGSSNRAGFYRLRVERP